MQIIARENVQGDPIDTYYQAPSLIVGNCYEIIGIEYEYYRIVDDYLDPILIHPIFCDVQNFKNVNNWVADINDDHFFLTPREFSIYPYFFEGLHDANLEYVDIYLYYLNTLLPTADLVSKIYSIYNDAINHENTRVSYWLKEWMKYLFNVDKAVDLRRFNEADWKQKLYTFFES